MKEEKRLNIGNVKKKKKMKKVQQAYEEMGEVDDGPGHAGGATKERKKGEP